MTDFAENKVIDALFRGQSLGAPATWHVSLHTSSTTDAGGGTEVSGGSYARVAVTASLANFAGTQGAGTTVASTGTGGVTSNNGAITFPAATGSWGTVTHFALWDASTSGNMWVHGALSASLTVNTGITPSFSAAQLTLTAA